MSEEMFRTKEMSEEMSRVVVGLYDSLQDARDAVAELINNGFIKENISLIAQDENGEYSRYIGDTEAEETVEGAVEGAGVGAVVGGVGGLLLGLGALAIPGVGPIIAAGPIAAALAGAGLGAAAGGLIGALTGAGVPEERAKYYEEGIRQGGTLVTVTTTDQMASKAAQILNRFSPKEVEVERESGYEFEPQFRTHFQTHYLNTGGTWEEYEPAYHYGYELANDEHYRGRDWFSIEAEARRDWERRYVDTPWENFKDAVRAAWETVTGQW